jgi:hypothetical protein
MLSNQGWLTGCDKLHAQGDNKILFRKPEGKKIAWEIWMQLRDKWENTVHLLQQRQTGPCYDNQVISFDRWHSMLQNTGSYLIILAYCLTLYYESEAFIYPTYVCEGKI